MSQNVCKGVGVGAPADGKPNLSVTVTNTSAASSFTFGASTGAAGATLFPLTRSLVSGCYTIAVDFLGGKTTDAVGISQTWTPVSAAGTVCVGNAIASATPTTTTTKAVTTTTTAKPVTTTTATVPTVAALPKPTDVVAKAGNASALVSWVGVSPAAFGSPFEKVPNKDLTYIVTAYDLTHPAQSLLTQLSQWCTVAVTNGSAGSMSCTSRNLTNGDRYEFFVEANSEYAESTSNPSSAVTPEAAAVKLGVPPLLTKTATLPPPTDVVSKAGDGSATVTWLGDARSFFTSPADYDTLYYAVSVTHVTKGTTGGQSSSLICVVQAPALASRAGACKVGDLVNGDSYEFTVTAFDDGEHASSSPSSPVTPSGPISAPVTAAVLPHPASTSLRAKTQPLLTTSPRLSSPTPAQPNVAAFGVKISGAPADPGSLTCNVFDVAPVTYFGVTYDTGPVPQGCTVWGDTDMESVLPNPETTGQSQNGVVSNEGVITQVSLPVPPTPGATKAKPVQTMPIQFSIVDEANCGTEPGLSAVTAVSPEGYLTSQSSTSWTLDTFLLYLPAESQHHSNGCSTWSVVALDMLNGTSAIPAQVSSETAAATWVVNQIDWEPNWSPPTFEWGEPLDHVTTDLTSAADGYNLSARVGAYLCGVFECAQLLMGGDVTALAQNGSGTMATPTSSVLESSAGHTLSFTYTAAKETSTAGGTMGAVTLTVPAGWSAPSTTKTNPGYTTVSTTGGTSATVTISGRTITVAGPAGYDDTSHLTLAAGQTVTITYGSKAGGGPGATAPKTTGKQIWQTEEDAWQTAGTAPLEPLAASASPSIAVTS